jgi:heat-inducible transcriptional repressor
MNLKPLSPILTQALTERQKSVLSTVIQEFITHSEPVSSKLISENSNIQASSATIRNTMAELEKLGFLEQQHTSGGRQPTDLGYRFYIDSLVQLQTLASNEKRVIDEQLQDLTHETEILRHASSILGQMTNLLGIAASHNLLEETLSQVQLISVAEKKVMLIVSLESGLVRNLMMELSIDIPAKYLESISHKITERVAGKSVSFLNRSSFNELNQQFQEEFAGPIRLFTRSILKLFQSPEYDNVEIYGTKNIIQQPEFGKIEDIEGIIELLDNKKTLVHFLHEREKYKGVQVTIGQENTVSLFKTHSVITSNYNLGGIQGTIGVIGPTRMQYSKLISVVDYTAKKITEKNTRNKDT